MLANHFREQDLTETVVVSPDLGNAKSATQFARLLGLPVAAGNRQRISDDTVVLDDEIANGGSVVELLDKLNGLGCPGAAVACTHGLFVGKARRPVAVHSMIREVVTTDTVPGPKSGPR